MKEYTLEKAPLEKPKEQEGDLPIYYEKLKLEKEQKDRIIKEILDEYDEIVIERDEKKLDQKWDDLDAQYRGEVVADDRRMFNLCRKITKIKVKRIAGKIMKAFMDSDPIYSVSPRPEFARSGGDEVCEKQQDFLDDRLDNLPFRKPMGQVAHSTTLKGTGFMKIYHLIKSEKRKREEEYTGTPGKGEKPIPVGVGQDGRPITILNDGMNEFLRNWPDALKDYPGYVKQLMEGKKIRFVCNYTEVTYNDPAFKCINLKDFFARISCDGYEGLKTTRTTLERQEYTYWDLVREQRRGFFWGIDDLLYKDKEQKIKEDKFENKIYDDIYECVHYTKLQDTDDEETKIVCWISKSKKVMIGAIAYPYYAIDCYYVPFYIGDEFTGLYGPGVGEDMTDSNLAENAILNNILEGAYMRNTITPVVDENSAIVTQFLEKTWTHGIPMTKSQGETVDFLQKYMQQMDIPGMLNLMQYLVQGDDDTTGVSSLMSGRESPIDPNAPAAKTIALLNESGENVAEYIKSMAPSFNIVGYILLQMYFQMATDGVKYQPKPERVVGSNPFSQMTRADMAAKTMLQVNASGFDFNRVEAAKKNLAFYQTFRQDPIIARYPQAVYIMAKQVIKSWGDDWRVLADQLLPPPEQFAREQAVNAAKGVAMFVQTELTKAKMTGQPPQFDPNALMAAANQMAAESVTPPPPEVIKARAEGAQA